MSVASFGTQRAHELVRPKRLAFLMLVMGIGAGLLSSPGAHAAEFISIGDLAGGPVDSRARGISGDGQVVVGSSQDANGFQAIRWTRAGGIESLGSLDGGGTLGFANAASFDGSVIVGYSDSVNARGRSEGEAFRWDAVSGMQGLGDLAGGPFQSLATDVSADGSIIVGHSTVRNIGPSSPGNTGVLGAFRWDATTAMGLLPALPNGVVPEASSSASAITADGTRVFGTYEIEEGFSSFVWDAAGGTRALPDLGPDVIEFAVTDISPDGSRAVGYGRDATSAAFTGMLWEEGVGITFLDRDRSFVATSMSADGSIVGSDALAGETSVWTAETGIVAVDVFLNALGLDVEGWNFREVQGFSDDGLTMVGWGINPNGDVEGWVAIVPEPSSAVLIGLGLAFLGARSRRV